MITTALATIFYQNKLELERLRNSIPNDNAIDLWFVIDGPFQYFAEQVPQIPPLSTDGSREIIKDSPLPFILVDMPFATEHEKRNHYLKLCKEYDIQYLIICDSDDFFMYTEGITPERSWDIFKKNFEMLARKNAFQHNVFSIRTLDTKTNTESSCPRCWFNPGDMRYLRNSHYHYGNPYNTEEYKKIYAAHRQNLNYCQESRGVIKGLTLAHDHSLRTKEQLRLREQYQRYLVTYESLVQNGYSHKKAHHIAKANPSKEFNPTV